MLVAIVTARLGDVEGIIDLLALEEWSYLVMFLVIAIRSPGPPAVDDWLARRFARRQPTEPPNPLTRPGGTSSTAA